MSGIAYQHFRHLNCFPGQPVSVGCSRQHTVRAVQLDIARLRFRIYRCDLARIVAQRCANHVRK